MRRTGRIMNESVCVRIPFLKVSKIPTKIEKQRQYYAMILFDDNFQMSSRNIHRIHQKTAQ